MVSESVAFGPKRILLPIYAGEDSRIDFETALKADLLEDDTGSEPTTITVFLQNPDGGTVHQYTGSVDTWPAWHVNVTGSNHPNAGVARGRVEFDGVTQADSEFEIEIKEAFA